MKKQIHPYTIGVIIFSLFLVSGSIILWRTQVSIDTEMAEQEEARRPAEIELTLIAPSSCELCVDGEILLGEIERQDVRVLQSEIVSAETQEGLFMIDTYDIERLPAIVIEGEYNKENIRDVLESLEGEERAGGLVIELKRPVYVEVASGRMIGLVDLTYITDLACTDCYDPTEHKTILENTFALAVSSETTVDAYSTEGQALIQMYDIKQTPTILLSDQALSYQTLTEVWEKVGTIEPDGTFVFRNNEAIGAVTYRDVETGTIIQPNASDE